MSAYNEFDHISIAIVSNSSQHRNYIQRAMQCIGIEIALSEPLTSKTLDKMDSTDIDIVLLDIDEDIQDSDMFDRFLDQSTVPVIFNDVTALTLNKPSQLNQWYGNLLTKIAELTGRKEWDELDINQVFESRYRQSDVVDKRASKSKAGGIAKNVWVLGSSLGGPEMLKQFLATVPAELPVAFILAQHMGANFTSLLAEQLNRITHFNVMPAKQGHVLKHHEVVVTPVNQRLRINPIGAVELTDIEVQPRYSPSIDQVIEDVAIRYGEMSGAIIFSGMGDDGCAGAAVMKQKHGQVWAQDAKSCVVSSMPDSVRAINVVSLTDNPVELAKYLAKYYS